MNILTWQARNDKNVTLVKLSGLTGISKSTLNNIENGRVSPTIKQLEAIAKALGVGINDLYESQYKNNFQDNGNRGSSGYNLPKSAL